MPAILLLLAFQDIEALLGSAQECLARNDLPGAARDYTRVLEKDPSRFEAFLGRGKVRLKTGDPDGSRRDLEEAVRLNPKSSDALFWRGVLKEQLKDLPAAVEDFTRSIEAGGRNPVVRLRRATCFCYLGRFAEARSDLDAIVAQGHRTYESFSLRAWARFELLDFKGTVSDATRVLELNPHDAEARRRRSLAYGGLRSWDNALRDRDPADPAGAFLRDRLAGGSRVPAPDDAANRVEVEASRREKVARALEALEAKLRAQPPFRAEYAVSGLDDLLDGRALSRLILDVDLAQGRFVARMTTERDWSMTVEVRDRDTFVWGSETPARRIENRFFRADFEGWPAEAGPPPPDLLGIDVTIEGRPTPAHRGQVKLAAGFGGRAASWLAEPGRSPGTTCREEKDAVIFELPASRKTLVVDRSAGILRSLRAVDFDGRVRELTLVSRTAAGEPPVRPARFQRAPLDFGALQSLWEEREEALAAAFPKDGPPAILTRWAARYADSMHRFALRSLVRSQLEAGDSEEADLRKGVEARAQDLRNFRRAQLVELAFSLETRLLELPVDSRLHAGLKKLLTEAFQFDKVEAERAGDSLDRILREELESSRKR